VARNRRRRPRHRAVSTETAASVAQAPDGPGPGRRRTVDAALRRAMLRFIGIFLLSAVVLFLIYWISDTTGRFDAVNRLNAQLSGVILDAIGIDNTRHGTVVQFRTGGMEVISECSGVYVAILFAAGVLAFPANWRARLKGLGLGLLAIFAINVLRLVTLGAIIAHKRAWLPLFHEYLWQVLFILVVAGLYLMWIERMVPRERLDPAT
jgi:exosortase H (IPTLxxWG-CTERM-specific)